MTVTNNVSEVEYYGDAVTTEFPVPFPYLADDDLTVLLINRTTGAYAIQTIVTHYTVSPDGGASGTVTMGTAPTTLQKLKIVRRVPITQLLDYVENTTFPAENHEDAVDKLTMIAQDLYRQIREGVLVSIAVQDPVPDQGPGDGVAGLTNVFVAKITDAPTGTDHPFVEQEPLDGSVDWQDRSGGLTGVMKSMNGLTTDWTDKIVVVFSYEDSDGNLDYRFEPPGELSQ